MRKTYTYENAIITITLPNTSIENIHNATKIFLHKVIKEKENGNNYQSRNFIKK